MKTQMLVVNTSTKKGLKNSFTAADKFGLKTRQLSRGVILKQELCNRSGLMDKKILQFAQ